MIVGVRDLQDGLACVHADGAVTVRKRTAK